MLNDYFFIVARREGLEITTTMQVEVSVQSPSRLSTIEIHDKVREAVTAWVRNTTVGKEAWDASREDFNIGDLAEHQYDTELVTELNKVGIRTLKLDQTSVISRDWSFDHILVKEDVE